ncbi:MAG: MBL fold metallo-hydrolase [Candidatus Latescibacterota bacterium]
MQVCVLASGSSGNALYVSEKNTAILVDAGLSGKNIEQRLRAIGVDGASLSGIVVTHEHSDHVQGVGILARRFGLPIHTNAATFDCVRRLLNGKERVEVFEQGTAFPIGELNLHPFSVSHDAADPSGFVIANGASSIGIATDLGCVTHLVRERLRGTDLVVLESNHDEQMLRDGSYPWELKQRIRGRFGHLSNGDAASFVRELAELGLERGILAHLSRDNNRPELARESVWAALREIGADAFHLSIAEQDRVGEVVRI